MNPGEHQPNDFIRYPTNRVAGTIADPTRARAAIEALLQRGIDAGRIDVLRGEAGLHRLDPDGAEHGFWARFQRMLINAAAVNEESRRLRHHVDDLRAGRLVIMVLAGDVGTRQEIAETLKAHGAEHIGFFGRWAWEALDNTTASAIAAVEGLPVGHRFEAAFDGGVMQLRFDSQSTMTVTGPTRRDAETLHVRATELRPGVVMVSWLESNQIAVVHLYDFVEEVAYASITDPGGTLRHMTGTLRRLD